MVAFVANAPVNFNAFELFDAFPDVPSPTMFSNQQATGFDIAVDATTALHVGGIGFTYVAGIVPNPANGAVQSISLIAGGATLYALAGLNLPLSSLFPLNGAGGFSINVPMLTAVFAGNDVITGSNQSDRLIGFGGSDTIFGLGGHDTLVGGPGADTMSGGLGNDSFSVDNPLDVVIDAGPGFDAVHTSTTFRLTPAAPIEVLRVASPASASQVNLTGSSAANAITGNNGTNRLTGLGSDDALSGLGGTDLLFGGAGKDRLTGGLGRDTMDGGAGGDVFEFSSIVDSRPGALRDTINFFSHAHRDKIDLRDIDADMDGTAGNQAFRFIGSAPFSGVDGQLRFAFGLLQGDVNGDRRADFEVRVSGTLVAGDVLL